MRMVISLPDREGLIVDSRCRSIRDRDKDMQGGSRGRWLMVSDDAFASHSICDGYHRSLAKFPTWTRT